MKKNMINVLNTVFITSTMIAPFAWGQSRGELQSVLREGNDFKITYCDARLRDNEAVQLMWDNNQSASGVLRMSDVWVDGKICLRHNIKADDAQLVARRSLNVLRKSNNEVLATISANQISPNTAPQAPAQAGQYQIHVNRTSGERLSIRVCGGDLRENESIKFRIGGNGIDQTATVRKSGNQNCVVKEYTMSTLTVVQGNIEIIARRGENPLFAQNVTDIVRGKATATDSQARPAQPTQQPPVQQTQPTRPNQQTRPTQPAQPYQQQPQQPQKPVAPAKPILDEATARKAGSDASTWVVKYIVETLGRIERIRANFFKGFSDVAKQNEAGEARLTREYAVGAQESEGERTKISSQATRAGQSAANQSAAVQAETDVKNRIRSARTGQQPDFTLSANLNFDQIISSYSGSGQYLGAAASMDERLRAIDREIQNELRPLFVRPEGIVLADDFFSLNYGQNQGQTVRQFTEDLVVNRNRRASNAFRGFNDNKFPSIQTNDYRNRYLSIPQTFENGMTGQMWFESGFQEQYNNMIADAWNTAVRADTLEARRSYTMGSNTYNRLFRDYSYELGKVERANRIYNEAQRQAFAESYEEAYRGHFARVAQQAQSSALIEVLASDVAVYVSSGSGDQMTLGDTFTVAIKKATNLGGKGDTVQVTVGGQGIVMDDTASFDVAGFSTMSEEKIFQNLARIQQISTTATDGMMRLVVNLQGQGISSNVRVVEVNFTLEALLKKLATDPQSQHTDKLVDLLLGYLKNEWDENSGSMWGTVYNNESGKLVVERLANYYKSLADGQKDNLKRHLPRLITAFNGGVRPGYWTVSRDDFDEAMEILKNVGLEIKK